ncbi:hypothetical protein PP766_gp34 [Escherichia phage U1G]|uniref:Uncharacterized protein n=1 Tax=Escherichia phage U1G TaxID=2853091 RepID=A0AAE7SSN1_9CAUD|nr:hypothetical protein PP766_gp34 [Escherichia phage U1G]QXV71867.1 hypothetical protein [Escherichia phage U1G]
MHSGACGSYFQLIAYPSPNPSPPNPWAFLFTGTVMFQNRRGKSVLHDMDFSKLEERLIAHAGIHDSVDVTVSKVELKNLENMLSKMKQTLIHGWSGRQVFVDTYIPRNLI